MQLLQKQKYDIIHQRIFLPARLQGMHRQQFQAAT